MGLPPAYPPRQFSSAGHSRGSPLRLLGWLCLASLGIVVILRLLVHKYRPKQLLLHWRVTYFKGKNSLQISWITQSVKRCDIYSELKQTIAAIWVFLFVAMPSTLCIGMCFIRLHYCISHIHVCLSYIFYVHSCRYEYFTNVVTYREWNYFWLPASIISPQYFMQLFKHKEDWNYLVDTCMPPAAFLQWTHGFPCVAM